MNYVEPIRDPSTVKDISKYLKEKNQRDYIMYLLGIYNGLRISDILRLKVSDVKNKSRISIREKKTNKQKIFELNPVVKRAIDEYIKDKDPDDYLIKSRQYWNRPISRIRAYQIMTEVAETFNLQNIGTHTLRKTFGYHFYIQTKDVVTLQKIFNHSDPGVTLRYIGIEQESINKAVRQFKIY